MKPQNSEIQAHRTRDQHNRNDTIVAQQLTAHTHNTQTECGSRCGEQNGSNNYAARVKWSQSFAHKLDFRREKSLLLESAFNS